jgi:signal transduction histidine kinase
MLRETRPDLLLLDLNLLDVNGLVLWSALRRLAEIPVILLADRQYSRDSALGLRLGADDVIVKPFSLSELEASVEAVVQRTMRARTAHQMLRAAQQEIRALRRALEDIGKQQQRQAPPEASVRLEERERIAMDLHDGVVQSLYGVVLELAAQEGRLDASETRASLSRARTQIEGAIGELRQYLSVLRAPGTMPADLRTGLELLADQLRARAPLRVELEVDLESEDALGPEAIEHLLYTVREATSNVIRHARASVVMIQLAQVDRQLVLTIRDDGRGLDPAERDRRRGDGLRHMAERAARTGGRLTVTGQLGAGTEVRLQVPLDREAVAQ